MGEERETTGSDREHAQNPVCDDPLSDGVSDYTSYTPDAPIPALGQGGTVGGGESTPPVLTRLCPRCQEIKKREEFYRDKGRAGDMSFYCKVCTNTRAQQLNIVAKKTKKQRIVVADWMGEKSVEQAMTLIIRRVINNVWALLTTMEPVVTIGLFKAFLAKEKDMKGMLSMLSDPGTDMQKSIESARARALEAIVRKSKKTEEEDDAGD